MIPAAVDQGVHPGRTLPSDTRIQIRAKLRSGAGAFVLLVSLTALMLFTPVFDGHIGGVGIGYVAAFVNFLVVLTVATVHCVRSNRLDDDREVG
jgi:hypothetical protein